MIEGTKQELRRVLHRIVDAAIAADDAIDQNDADALGRAMDALLGNVEKARNLAAMTSEVSHV